jgi:hypothetical protein
MRMLRLLLIPLLGALRFSHLFLPLRHLLKLGF